MAQRRAWWEIPGLVGIGALLFYGSLRFAMGATDKVGVWAKRFGIPRKILAGIVRTESRGKARAKRLTGGDARRGGAWGLTQVTLATANDLIPRIRRQNPEYNQILDRFDGTGPSLFDKDLNLLLAAFKLSSDRAARGNWDRAVLAYNRGRQGARNYLGDPRDNRYVSKVLAA